MAFTQADLDALDKAIKSGAMQVQYQDKSVRYRSLDEMMRIKRVMVDEISQITVTRRRSPIYCKGT